MEIVSLLGWEEKDHWVNSKPEKPKKYPGGWLETCFHNSVVHAWSKSRNRIGSEMAEKLVPDLNIKHGNVYLVLP